MAAPSSSGDGIDSEKLSFKDLGLESCLTTQCKLLGFLKPTKIQIDCIPAILKGSFSVVRDPRGVKLEGLGFVSFH